uniref:TRAF3 interacting protein 3 n=1 Tax=Sphenodon punctatus TaxID=8508 RepID=A0A8D0GJM0_SPHPU
MISPAGKFPLQHRHLSESYDDKCERRQEVRENLRRRNNLTTCRRIGKNQDKEAEGQLQSPRQREFLRRRNLMAEGPGRKEVRCPTSKQSSLGQENGMEGPGGDLQSSATHQSFQCNLLHDALAYGNLHSWRVSSENIRIKEVSKNRGTQTLAGPSVVKRDSGQQTDCGIAVSDKEMIQLCNYLKEALHRELLLKQKTMILQELLSALLQALEKSWKGQLNEEKLKGKLRALENQLQDCSQSCSKEDVKRILVEMEDQKQSYEQKAKESLQKLLNEKLEAEQQLQSTQRALAVTEEDCALWKEHYAMLKADWRQLTSKHIELENKLHVLQNKLQWSDAQNLELHQAVCNLESERANLYSKIDTLKEEGELRMEHISAMQGKLQSEERQKLALEVTVSHLNNQVLTMHSQSPNPDKERQNALPKDPEGKNDSSLKDQLQERTSQLTAKEKECTELHLELEALSDEYHSCLSKLRQCRDELNHFQGKQAQKQQGRWFPVLIVMVATATAAFLANFIP